MHSGKMSPYILVPRALEDAGYLNLPKQIDEESVGVKLVTTFKHEPLDVPTIEEPTAKKLAEGTKSCCLKLVKCVQEEQAQVKQELQTFKVNTDEKIKLINQLILPRLNADKLTLLKLKETDQVKGVQSKHGRCGSKVKTRLKLIPGGMVKCNMCKRKIENKYLLQALDKYWHEKCLKCDFCRKPLYKFSDRFYNRQGAKFCQEDYLRTFGDRGICSMCDHVIPPTDYVMKFKGNLLYHLDCFQCISCQRRFCVGDPITITNPKTVLCAACKYISKEDLQRAYHEKFGQQASVCSLPMSTSS